ncbi:hypothetical protein BDQ12DRAFT_678086 [Crucibulum laeve]|uniref:Beta-lactamase-like protein n=1 Tax=Crucibulum laeve TaxID=68775 RepID=A0A5C3M7R7_9AGAR|nr:hypothetical protein BDQ12DRAFT_678086 [Crucibulum laeve]
MSQNLTDLVIREVTPEIWTFSRPFVRFGFLPWGGRSTAVKLSNGVWVLASTPLTEDTKTTIDKLGPVKWIMGADAIHHLFLAEYKKAYPEAKVIGVEPLFAKKQAEGLELDGAYGKDSPETTYGFEDEIKACYFSGFKSKDVAWFHVASKTLIQADLLFNLPGTEQYSKVKKSPKIPIIGKFDPWGSIHKRFVWGQGADKEAMRRDAKIVAGWDFERIIMCHGDVIEKDGKKAWSTAYSKYLE